MLSHSSVKYALRTNTFGFFAILDFPPTIIKCWLIAENPSNYIFYLEEADIRKPRGTCDISVLL